MDAADLLERHANGERDFSGADLSGQLLVGAVLAHANFSGCNLRGASLDHADLCGADFSRADLRGAGMRAAWCALSSFSRASLTNADLTDADLTEAALHGADLSGTQLTGAKLAGVYSDDLTTWPAGLASMASEAPVSQNEVLCAECGTRHNRRAVIREIKKQSPFIFDFDTWVVRFKCASCSAENALSGARAEAESVAESDEYWPCGHVKQSGASRCWDCETTTPQERRDRAEAEAFLKVSGLPHSEKTVRRMAAQKALLRDEKHQRAKHALIWVGLVMAAVGGVVFAVRSIASAW